MSLNPYSYTGYYPASAGTPGGSYTPSNPASTASNAGSSAVSNLQTAGTCPAPTHWLGTPANDPQLPALLATQAGVCVPGEKIDVQTSSARYWIWLIGTVGFGGIWLVTVYDLASERIGYNLTDLVTYLRANRPLQDLEDTILTAHGDACEDSGNFLHLERFIDHFLWTNGYSYSKTSGPSTEEPTRYILAYTASHRSDPQQILQLNFALRSSQLSNQGLVPAQPLHGY